MHYRPVIRLARVVLKISMTDIAGGAVNMVGFTPGLRGMIWTWQWPGPLGRRDPGHRGTAHECLPLGRGQAAYWEGMAACPRSMWSP